MEQLDGGGDGFRRWRQTRPAGRFLKTFEELPPPASPPLELSEHDIFAAALESSLPTGTQEVSRSSANGHHDGRVNSGILVALNEGSSTRSGSENRPVFNHNAASAASLASGATSMVMIPKRPPVQAERSRFHPQSAPVNVPLSTAGKMRQRDLEEIVSDEEIEQTDGMMLPPHEMVAARHSPMLACSVLVGAGRKLKGRDLRQVRNAIWRKTGFLD